MNTLRTTIQNDIIQNLPSLLFSSMETPSVEVFLNRHFAIEDGSQNLYCFYRSVMDLSPIILCKSALTLFIRLPPFGVMNSIRKR